MKQSNNEAIPTFVSRAGSKLEFALKHFKLNVNGFTVADFGSSTGGFVDCLLQNGASKVYSIDTAYGELAWKIRNDPKVVIYELLNVLTISRLYFATFCRLGVVIPNTNV